MSKDRSGELPQIRILSSETNDHSVYPLGRGTIRIGRSAENEIVIHDSLVSRHHLELEFDGAAVTLKDIGGKNPVRINGIEAQDTRLCHGDRITLGQTELLFEHPGALPASPLRIVKDGKTTFDPGIGGLSLDAATEVFGKPDLSDLSATEKSYARLARLYVMTGGLLKVVDEEQLFDLVLSTATQDTNAERGFIGLAEEGNEEDPHALNVVRFWDPVRQGQAQTLEMSETILSHIQRNRQAVLVRDVPDRHDFGVSVIDLKIRSFICVPLLSPPDPTGGGSAENRFLGLLYVDTRGSRQQFDKSDLEFVNAIGQIAGAAFETLRVRRRLQRENERLRSFISVGGELVGSSEPMKRVFQLIDKVAPRDASVLITGENGTGKELIARAIHERSARKGRPFVAVNCGAIPPNLVESELFGYEKGAFTGAAQMTEGKFDMAHEGTLFLDEIGDMPIDMQVKILRALQERRFYRVGGKKEISVDIRVIAATNRDLQKAIEKGQFREDLYFRLAVVMIEVPPLRARGDDVLEIAERFLGQSDGSITLTPAARESLLNYHWPGNIRELRNVLEQAVILGDGKKIAPSDLPKHIARGGRGKMLFRLKPLAEIEKQYILRVLDDTEGNKAKAASLLGISRETLYQKLKTYEEASS